LKKALHEADSEDMKQSLLLTFGQLGTVVQGELLLAALLILVEYLAHSNPALRVVADDQLHQISAKKAVPLSALLKLFRHDIYPFLLERLPTIHN